MHLWYRLRRSRHGVFMLAGVLFVITGTLFILYQNITEHIAQCRQPFGLPIIRPFIVTEEDRIHEPALADRYASLPENVAHILGRIKDYDLGGNQPNALLWAWLEFIGHDMYPGTPFIDASHIYGSTAEDIMIRRSGPMGYLRMFHSREYPTGDTSVAAPRTLDHRASQNLIVHALYILWFREHNRMCDKIKHRRPQLSDSEIFNFARHTVIAQIQTITYREFIPMLIGEGIIGSPDDCFQHINVFPSREYFSSSVHLDRGFSLGVLALARAFEPIHLDVYNGYTHSSFRRVILADHRHNNSFNLIDEEGISGILLGAITQPASGKDLLVPAKRVIDLITASRQASVPSYQTYYSEFLDTFDCKHVAYNNQLCNDVLSVYGDTSKNPIDLLVGLIFEKRYDNGVLGMVGHHLAKSHFELVKQNDPYFYAWDRAVGDFVIEIHNTRLYSAIIKNSNIPVSSITHPNTFVVRY